MADDEVIYIALEPWVYGDDQRQLQFRVSADYYDEMTRTLDEFDVPADRKLEFSAVVDTAVWLISGGGLFALRAMMPAIQTFITRHKDKKFRIKVGDIDVSSEGFSEKQTQSLIEKAFEKTEGEQREAWKRLNPLDEPTEDAASDKNQP